QFESANAGIQPVHWISDNRSSNASNPSVFAADNSFMVWGSDDAAGNFATAYAFSNMTHRMTRIWKVQESGTVGTVKVALSSDDLAGLAQLHLLVSNDALFDGSDTKLPMILEVLGGVAYYTANVDISNGQFFTFGGFLVGPGGVVDTDFWVKSDDAGNLATAWKDHSKNSNPIEAVGAWSLTSADAEHNFYPYTSGFSTAKYFKDEKSSLTLDNTFSVQTRTPYTVFSAVKPNGATGRIIGIDNDELFAAEPGFSIQNNKPYFYEFFEVAGSDIHSQTISSGFTSVLSFNAQQLAANSCNMRMGKDGIYENFARTGYFHNLGENLVLGYGTFDLNAAFPGDIMEIAWYKRDLTPNEQDRVNSYLGIKNGVTLSIDYLTSASNIIWNRTNNSGFNNNIFGIGRDDASGLTQKQAKPTDSAAKMTIGVADSIAPNNAAHPSTFSTDGDFLMIGDNGLTGVITPSVSGACPPPPSADKASAQKFKIVETGSVQSVKILYNPSGLGYNSGFPVYMQVASDSNFTNLIANVPMLWVGSDVTTNYDFAANSATFVRFMGNTTSLANICTASKPQTFYFNGWNFGVKTKDIIANYGTSANAGDLIMKTTVTDGTPNVLLHRPTVDWYPVFDGYGLFFPRKGNVSTENSTITTKIEFLAQATNGAANASTTKLAAQTASFMIWDLDGFIGSRDIVKVYGKLGGQTVNAKLIRNKYTALTLNHAGDPQSVIGGVLPWDLSYWGRLYVNFDSPVEEIYVEYKQDATYNFKTYQDFRIGPITATCKPIVPKVVTPDNVYIAKEVASPVKSGDVATYKFTIQNTNCGDKTINFSDILPTGSGLIWADSSLSTPLSIGTTNAYGNTQTLTLNNVTVPAGTSYIFIDAKTSTNGTFNNQATFSVGANNYTTDDPNAQGTGNQATPLTVIDNDPEANLTLTKSVDKPTEMQNGIVTYTFTVTNPNATAVNATLEDILPASSTGVSPTFVASSLTGAGAAIVSAYADESELTIRNLAVPANGNVVITIQVNTGLFAVGDTIKNAATVVPDVNAGYRLTTQNSGSANTIITPLLVPDLTTKIGQPTPALVANQTSNLPITVNNIGTGAAPGVITTSITLPTGVSAPATFSSNGSTCNTNAQTVTCTNPGPIAASDSIRILVPITPTAAIVGTNPTFNATTTPVSGETNTANNAATPTTTTQAVTASSVLVSAKVFLSGNFDPATGLMHDSLRLKNLIPSAQPYGTLGYMGAETFTPSVLSATGSNAIVDWVLVEIRDAATPTTIVARAAGLLQRDGDIVGSDGMTPLSISAASGNYFVAVRHRNHLGVMTATAIALSATTTTVDFTSTATANYQKSGLTGSPFAQKRSVRSELYGRATRAQTQQPYLQAATMI
ncbi:MAG: hypothetical protein HC817_03425, partial [Saprospiraceae bacterium]|nr:hypothetical protein [Saprospiraceae bacterium]